MDAIDYLIIGHASQDVTPTGPRLGGAVTFSGLTAHALGFRVGVVTSVPDAMQPLLAPLLRHAAIVRVPADEATTFENSYTDNGRVQRLTGRATPLGWAHIPEGWREASLVHLAPIADEVDPTLARQFAHSFVAAAPQGWMRTWDAAGHVTYQPWRNADNTLSEVDAVSLSIEDVQHDEAVIAKMAQKTSMLAVTRGGHGCTLYIDGRAHHIDTVPVDEVDPTGAGDIFAAAFYGHFVRTGDPQLAARFASYLASESVTRSGLASIPDEQAINRARQWATR